MLLVLFRPHTCHNTRQSSEFFFPPILCEGRSGLVHLIVGETSSGLRLATHPGSWDARSQKKKRRRCCTVGTVPAVMMAAKEARNDARGEEALNFLETHPDLVQDVLAYVEQPSSAFLGIAALVGRRFQSACLSVTSSVRGDAFSLGHVLCLCVEDIASRLVAVATNTELVGDQAVAVLARAPGVRTLAFSKATFGDAGMASLFRREQGSWALEHVAMEDHRGLVTPVGIKHAAGAGETLRAFTLHRSLDGGYHGQGHFQSGDWADLLASCPRLSRIGCDFSPALGPQALVVALDAISRHPSIVDVHFLRADFGWLRRDQHHLLVAFLPRLRSLRLEDCLLLDFPTPVGGCHARPADTLVLVRDYALRLEEFAVTGAAAFQFPSKCRAGFIDFNPMLQIISACPRLRVLKLHRLVFSNSPGLRPRCRCQPACATLPPGKLFPALEHLQIGCDQEPCPGLSEMAFASCLDRCVGLRTLKVLGRGGLAKSGLGSAIAAWRSPRGTLDLSGYFSDRHGWDVAVTLLCGAAAFTRLHRIWLGDAIHIPRCSRRGTGAGMDAGVAMDPEALAVVRAAGLPVLGRGFRGPRQPSMALSASEARRALEALVERLELNAKYSGRNEELDPTIHVVDLSDVHYE